MNLTVSAHEARCLLQEQLDIGEQLTRLSVSSAGQLLMLRDAAGIWEKANEDLLGRVFLNERQAKDYRSRYVILPGDGPLPLEVRWVHHNIGSALEELRTVAARLGSSVAGLEPIRRSYAQPEVARGASGSGLVIGQSIQALKTARTT